MSVQTPGLKCGFRCLGSGTSIVAFVGPCTLPTTAHIWRAVVVTGKSHQGDPMSRDDGHSSGLTAPSRAQESGCVPTSFHSGHSTPFLFSCSSSDAFLAFLFLPSLLPDTTPPSWPSPFLLCPPGSLPALPSLSAASSYQ